MNYLDLEIEKIKNLLFRNDLITSDKEETKNNIIRCF